MKPEPPVPCQAFHWPGPPPRDGSIGLGEPLGFRAAPLSPRKGPPVSAKLPATVVVVPPGTKLVAPASAGGLVVAIPAEASFEARSASVSSVMAGLVASSSSRVSIIADNSKSAMASSTSSMVIRALGQAVLAGAGPGTVGPSGAAGRAPKSSETCTV